MKYSISDIIEKSNKKHNNKYEYDLSNYVNRETKINIFCKKCESWFLQSSRAHINGQGCPICANNIKNTTEQIILKFEKVHKNRFLYDKVSYSNNKEKVVITCKKHGDFKQSPSKHLAGQGCPECMRENRRLITIEDKYLNKRTKLYYIKINDDLFKIGLTRTNVNTRFKNELKSGVKITVIFVKEFDNGLDAAMLENAVLNKTISYSIKKEDSPILCGYTEIRTKDIIDEINIELKIKGFGCI